MQQFHQQPYHTAQMGHNDCGHYGGYGGEQGYNPYAYQVPQQGAFQQFQPEPYPQQYPPQWYPEPPFQGYRPYRQEEYPCPMPSMYRQSHFGKPPSPPRVQPRDAHLVFFPQVEGVSQNAEEADHGYTRVYSFLVRDGKLLLIARADIDPEEYNPDKTGKPTDSNDLVKNTARRCTDGLNPKHRLGKNCVKQVKLTPTQRRKGTQVFSVIVDVTGAEFTKAAPFYTLATLEEYLHQAGPEGQLIWELLTQMANVSPTLDREQPLRIEPQEQQQPQQQPQQPHHVHMPQAAVFQNHHQHSNSSFRP